MRTSKRTEVQSGFRFACWFCCDFDLEFIFVISYYSVNKNAYVCEGFEAHQNAACRVLGFGPHMDSDACPFWNVTYLRHELFELWRPGFLEGINPFGNEEVGVLERVIGEGVARVEGEGYRAFYSFRLLSFVFRLLSD